MAGTFKFNQCIVLIKMTGKRASDLMELLEIIGSISPESIFHHMHQYFLKHHVIAPEFPNDFAVWVAESLGERSLAEALANLNPFGFDSIEEVRSELIRIITEHLKSFPPPRPVLPGREFFFNEGVTFVVPTGLEARDLSEFVSALRVADSSSIYFHFYEARLRLGQERDDFSSFIDISLCAPELAARIKSMDPYMYSTDDLKVRIIDLLEGAAA